MKIRMPRKVRSVGQNLFVRVRPGGSSADGRLTSRGNKCLANQRKPWPTHPKMKGVRVMDCKIKSRYISVKQDGSEIYVENLPLRGDIHEFVKSANYTLHLVRQAMPKANWSLTIEEEWSDGKHRRYFKILDIETGKLKEDRNGQKN